MCYAFTGNKRSHTQKLNESSKDRGSARAAQINKNYDLGISEQMDKKTRIQEVETKHKTRHIQSRSKNLVMYRSLCIGASGGMAFSTGFLGLIAKEFVCFPRDCLGFHWVLQPRHILPNHTYRANFNRLTTVRKVHSCPKPTKSTKPKIIDVTLLKLAIR